MRTLLFTLLLMLAFTGIKAQDFNKYLADARSSYSSKKLDDSRFAMQQMLQELDVMAGKDLLKILPVKLDALSANTSNDNVTGNSGFAGIMIYRDYGAGDKTAEIEIIGNSPVMASVNALLTLPFGQSNGDSKIMKVDGYKALLRKTVSDTNTVSYEIQVPLTSSLLTLKVNGLSEDAVQKLAATLPVAKLVNLL